MPSRDLGHLGPFWPKRGHFRGPDLDPFWAKSDPIWGSVLEPFWATAYLLTYDLALGGSKRGSKRDPQKGPKG